MMAIVATWSLILSWKTCSNLMAAMEKQGVFLDYFDVVENPDHAAYVGKKIG